MTVAFEAGGKPGDSRFGLHPRTRGSRALWSAAPLGARVAIVMGSLTPAAAAGVTTFSGEYNPAPWLAAAGPGVVTASFDGFADGTVVTDQLMDLGLVFTQPGSVVATSEYGNYLRAPNGPNWATQSTIPPTDGVRASFTAPMRSIGFNLFSQTQGNVIVTLYSGGQAFWTGLVGPCYSASYEFPWGFGGLVSDQPFDGVWISAALHAPNYPGITPPTALFIKDLSFSTVPAPGALVVLVSSALGVLSGPNRSRRQRA